MQALTIGLPTVILQFSRAASIESAKAGAAEAANKAAHRMNLAEALENGDLTTGMTTGWKWNVTANLAGNDFIQDLLRNAASLAIFHRAATEILHAACESGAIGGSTGGLLARRSDQPPLRTRPAGTEDGLESVKKNPQVAGGWHGTLPAPFLNRDPTSSTRPRLKQTRIWH